MIPLITIVIPTRNEAEDIADTLEAVLALDDPNKEVLVIDDSRDGTPDVVRRFADRGVRLHHRDINDNACCGARNEGIKRAAGEIVVLLNADARPESDFLTRIRSHYRSGAGYVIVRSEVQNPDSVWSGFLAAEGAIWFAKGQKGQPMEWSEGFSCRVDAAKAVGGIPGDFPVPFCRDWRLGEALGKAGFRKVTDLTIRVPHRVAETFGPFWRNQVWRGTMVAPASHYLGGRTLVTVCGREIARALRTVLRLLFLAHIWPAVRMRRDAGLPASRVPGLAVAGAVRDMAFSVGTLQGLGRVLRAQREGRRS
jgi:GT2 family glycosyltransferase